MVDGQRYAEREKFPDHMRKRHGFLPGADGPLLSGRKSHICEMFSSGSPIGIQVGKYRIYRGGRLADDHAPGGDPGVGGKEIDGDGQQIDAPHPGALFDELAGCRDSGTVEPDIISVQAGFDRHKRQGQGGNPQSRRGGGLVEQMSAQVPGTFI